MGRVQLQSQTRFLVVLENAEDRAALRAALKAIPGADREEVMGPADRVEFDSENPANVLALWAASFDWDHDALRLAMDQIAPTAWQDISLHARTGLSRRFQKKLMVDMENRRRQSPELGHE